MIATEKLLEILEQELLDNDRVLSEARYSEQFFTRERKISNNDFLLACLSHYKCSMTEGLFRSYEDAEIEDIPRKQALSKKRSQIDESPFKDAYFTMVKSIAEADGDGADPLIGGRRVIAIDGTDLALPPTDELRELFGTTGRGASSPTARVSTAFDVRLGVALDAAVVPISVGERSLAVSHLLSLAPQEGLGETIFVMDRGYCSKELFREFGQQGARFLMRVRNKFNLAIDDAATEDIVEIGDGQVVKVFKFLLDSGEIETVITNDLEMDWADAYEIYTWRWGVEEQYKTLKCRLAIECFTGRLPQVILQDFWIAMIHSLLVSAIAAEVDTGIKKGGKGKKRPAKLKYKANKNVIAGVLGRGLVQWLKAKDSTLKMKVLRRMLGEARRDLTPERPGRSNKRKKPRAARFHQNVKYN